MEVILFMNIGQSAFTSCNVAVMGVEVRVDSNLGWLPEQRMFGMWETSLDLDLSTSVTLVRTSDSPRWKLAKAGLRVEVGSSRVTRVSNPYFSAALFAAEIHRQQTGVFQLHAAGLNLPGGAVLLTGGSGAGKTITALRLCAEETVAYAGADRCQIGLREGKLALLGHWRNTRLRSSSALMLAHREAIRRRWSQDVLDWLGTVESGWDAKRTVSINDLGLAPLVDAAPISAIYDLRVLPPGSPLAVKPMLPRDAVYALAASLGDLTSGFLMVLDDDGRPLMPAFHDAFPGPSDQRTALAAAAHRIPRFRLRGGPDEVCRYLIARHGA
ncbi:hypothetical protein ABZ671_17520 [Micromonospora sp. NPDC006766]|uniref:hypothetical protein n=1 Tax=Micromonospora sp. NPDC006766 TaxID=3154778 RepID=UPI0033D93C2A